MSETTQPPPSGPKKDQLSISRGQIVFTLVILIIVVYGAYAFKGNLGFKELTKDDIYNLLINIGIITIVIERSLEIFVTIWRGQDRIPLDKDAEMDEDNLALVQAKFEKGKVEKKELSEAQNESKISIKVLEDYRGVTRVIAMRASLIAGIIVSIAGFRILSVIFCSTCNGSPLIGGMQLVLFNISDILLTAGILAGGSKGLHTLTELLGNFFDQSNKRLKSLGRTTTQK